MADIELAKSHRAFAVYTPAVAKQENKTKPTRKSVKAFIDGIEDEQRRKDCRTLSKVLRRATGASPKMWGDSIVGFGQYHYRYKKRP